VTAETRARELFGELYGSDPTLVVRAPGRVNLIGEHTDYNGGFVLPMAIDIDLVIAARPRGDQRVRVVSESQEDPADFTLEPLEHGEGWAEYLKGVASQLDTEALVGWDGAIASDLADGAGLSSSAAIEIATARVFAETSGLDWDPTAMAQVAQRGDNEWVGINSGIMDQLICATAREGHARLIDCRDLTGTHVPIPPQAAAVILDTGTRRRLLDSAYNDRRTACEAAARYLGVEQLRDARPEQVTPELPPELYIRARHVVEENARTLAAADAFTAGDLDEVGRLMNASHDSLRDFFEVSSPALDAMAKAAQAAPGCFGARQMGGGFAGSCVALVEAAQLPEFTEATLAGYTRSTTYSGTATPCRAAPGAGTIEP
jgi:galactokinase